MTNISENIATVLKKNNIINYELALRLLTVSKDLLNLELALRECEAYSLNRFERVNNPHIRTAGLPSSEGYDINIIENNIVCIEFIYGQNSPEPDICELPLYLYKALLQDYYFNIKTNNFYENGQLRTRGQSNNYLRFGLWTEYFHNGQIQSNGEYSNSQKIGIWQYFFENGQKKGIEFYDTNGYRYSTWETWYSNGQIQSSSFFKDNEYSEDHKYWYPNGQLCRHYRYSKKNKLKDGEHITWFENGQLETIIVVKDERTIKYRYYDENGKLTRESNG